MNHHRNRSGLRVCLQLHIGQRIFPRLARTDAVINLCTHPHARRAKATRLSLAAQTARPSSVARACAACTFAPPPPLHMAMPACGWSTRTGCRPHHSYPVTRTPGARAAHALLSSRYSCTSGHTPRSAWCRERNAMVSAQRWIAEQNNYTYIHTASWSAPARQPGSTSCSAPRQREASLPRRSVAIHTCMFITHVDAPPHHPQYE
mmetsp:Transcript_84026/g.167709  ORF Transcript_84026/g.167709 Transcript_84026/m.167709 type:complete len:205 (+) Transcript_84026:309-923(+)